MNRKEKLKLWRKRKTKPADEAALRAEAESRGLKLVRYKVNFGPMEDANLPAEADEAIQEVYPMVWESPEEAAGRLRDLIGRFPQVPQFRNHLAAALEGLGDLAGVEAAVRETYELFPDYLFARVNYGQYLLRQGRLAEVKALFPNGMEPQLMYPEREEFHVTEVRAVYVMAGIYHAKMGELEQARDRLEMLTKLEGDSPAVETLAGEIKMAILKVRTQKLFHLR